MRRPPDRLFVNCAVTPASGIRIERSPAFGANPAQAALRSGAGAAILAGLPVSDSLAVRFADVCYSHLLAGVTLAEATLDAQRVVYEAHAHDRTWAAYQSYGDPAFRLPSAAGPSHVAMA